MTENETYLYLDLNGKLDVNYFRNNKIFFKMINVDKKPMVQIGNYVFEGKYEDYLGTKVFFVEDRDHEPGDNIFERQSPIHLKYFVRTAKVLQLKWKSVPIAKAQESRGDEEYMDLRFAEPYGTVLEKFARAELNIKDISVRPKDDEEKSEAPAGEKAEEERDDVDADAVENDAEADAEVETTQRDVGLTGRDVFKEYVRLPKRRVEQQKLYEVKEEGLVKVVDADNYPVLKQVFLQNVSFDDIDLNKNNFDKYVNVEKSIRDGVIPETRINTLTDDLRSKLLHGDNFNNFTLPMKMAYLLVQLEQYKKRIKENSTQGSLKDSDQFGRTLIDKYKLLKYLIKDLWYIIYLNKPRTT